MMKQEDMQFALSDFWQLIKKNKSTILLWMFCGALACFWLTVTRPVQYGVQASFRDKGKTETLPSSLPDLFFISSSGHDSEAASTMRSQFLLGELIEQLNIQGIVSFETDNYFKPYQDSLLAEWAFWNSFKAPILADVDQPLKLVDIFYPGEVDYHLNLRFRDGRHFSIYNASETLVGEGEFDVPVQIDEIVFTVKNLSATPKAHDSYHVTLLPLHEAIKLLASSLTIEQDKDDKSLLKLQFRHQDRHFAALFLNTLMHKYQQRLEMEHDLISSRQLDYLEERQEAVSKKVEHLMQDFVLQASQDMSQAGFTSLQKEMEFLATNLAETEQHLTLIDFEMDRLERFDCENCVHYDSPLSSQDAAVINQVIEERRLLQRQADGLALALHNSCSSSCDIQKRIEENVRSLSLLQNSIQEAKDLLQAVERDRPALVALEALNSSNYPVQAWYRTYRAKKRDLRLAKDDSKETLHKDYVQFKAQFINYLSHFQRLLQIQANSLEQRIHTLQSPTAEFEGLTLHSTQELFSSYVQELHDLQAKEKQHRFLHAELQKPDFHVYALTALLQDPISLERIQKASEIMLNLKDENNRTSKERERLQDELALQITFLSGHLQQIADLLQLKEQLLKDKIGSLQTLMLDLTHQQVALLKDHLVQYIQNRVEHLAEEKISLEKQQARLQARMAAIPPKWASEQLLNHKLTMQQKFLENLAHMVESKNISTNLEMIQSRALDLSVAPLNPKPPRLLVFTILGSFLGCLGACGFLFTKALLKGMPVSQENLRLANFHFSGNISPFQGAAESATMPLLNRDLDTLRRLIAKIEKQGQQKQELLLLPGTGVDFSHTLAKLLAKKGLRTLKLELDFTHTQPSPGLLQYLENNLETAPIQHLDGFDLLPAGGASRYSEELLRSPRFMTLLNQLKSTYDWIIAVSPAKIGSAEAENLATFFANTALVITHESLQEILAFRETLDEKHQEGLSLILMSS